MAFDILGFYNKHKDYYGDAPLDKVAKDVYSRAGYDKEYPDFDTWAKQEGVDKYVQDDLKRRNPQKEGSALGALGKTLLSVPENIAASAITAIQGGGGASINDRGLGDRFVNWVSKRNEELSKEYEGTGDVIPGVISKQDIAQLGQNLGFSGVSMVAGAAGGVAGAPGGLGGIFAGRMLGAGAAAHRMQSYQTMNDWLNRKNEESIQKYGRGISPEEEKAFKDKFEGLASQSGLWEAGPEGVGTALELAVILAKNKTPGGKLIPDSVIKKLAKGAVKLGKVIGIEEATEAVTQMGQHNVEVEAGMAAGPKREWTSPEDWLTSAKEVLPAVLLLSGFIGGAGAVYNRLQAVEDNPPELEKEINKLKIGALATDFIDKGLKTGTVDGDPFTPENALEIIREGQNSGIYDSDSLERFKERYPQLRDGLNGVIAESIIKKIDEVASPEPRPDSISQVKADMERVKKIIPARNTEEDVPASLGDILVDESEVVDQGGAPPLAATEDNAPAEIVQPAATSEAEAPPAEATAGESVINQSLIEEARKYKSVDEFVQKTHGRFVANADKLTPEEKELSDAFYKADKEAVWNKAQETQPAPLIGQVGKQKPIVLTKEDIKSQVDELGNFTLPGDVLNKAFEQMPTEDIIDVMKWARGQSAHVNRNVTGNASAILRARKVPVDEINWQLNNLSRADLLSVETVTEPSVAGAVPANSTLLENSVEPATIPDVTTPKGTADIPAKTTPQAEAGLIEEAKKYKTADEFIKAQGDVLYHGTERVGDGFEEFSHFGTKKAAQDRINNEGYKNATIHEVVMPRGKYQEINDVGSNHAIDIAHEIGGLKLAIKAEKAFLEKLSKEELKDVISRVGFIDESNVSIKDILDASVDQYNRLNKRSHDILDILGDAREYFNKEATNAAYAVVKDYTKSKGIDGFFYKNIIEDKGKKSFLIIDTANIKTKSQLTDIWNKAHELPNPSRPPEVGGQSVKTPISETKPPLPKPPEDSISGKVEAAGEVVDEDIETLKKKLTQLHKETDADLIDEKIAAARKLKYLDAEEKELKSISTNYAINLAEMARIKALLSQSGEGTTINEAQEDMDAAYEQWNEYHEGEAYPHEIKLAQQVVNSISSGQGRLFKGQQYSVQSEGNETVTMPTLAEVQEIFKGQEVMELTGGEFMIRTNNGKFVTIVGVDHISAKAINLKATYGKSNLGKGETVAGGYANNKKLGTGVIKLVRGQAGKWTLAHESMHFVEDSGLLTNAEINLLKKHIQNLAQAGKFEPVNPENIGGEEDRANFIADAMTREPAGFLGRIIAKIKDFIDKLVNAFGVRTAGGVARDIRTGKVYDRQGGAGRGLDEYYKVAAWHGSPHDFDKFSKDKIGTGEGAQAYGHGLYFAGKREVAEFYKKRLSSNNDDSPGSAAEWVKYYGSKENALKSAKGQYDNELRFFAGREKEIADVHKTYKKLISELETYSPGRLYQVELAPDEDEYLLWDKPLSEQSEKVKKIILNEFGTNFFNKRYGTLRLTNGGILGEKFYRSLGGDRVSSERLHSLGIRGIKYLDGSSRGKGEGNYNYVIFSDEDVDIKEKYSIRKSQDPPTSRDPKVLNLYLKDETDALIQTMMNKLHPPHMTWLETILKSPEWFGHPQIQNIVKLFMRDRNEIYHETFNELNMADDIDAPESTVTEAAKALKNKGLSLADRMAGKVSPEYQRLQEIIDEGDTSWKRNTSIPLDRQIKEFEKHIRQQGATEETIRVWKLYRQSYDKALDLQTAQLRQMIDEITEEANFRGEKPDLNELRQTLKGALAQMEEWRGFYAPRLREQGNWKVQAYKEHGPMKENREWYREHRGSELSARRLANKLQREGWKIYSVGQVEKLPETIYQDVNATATAKLIDAALEKLSKKSALSNELTLKFNEEVLREVSNAIKARGFRSTMIRRGEKVVRGFIEDPIQRHLQYTNSLSGGIAKARVARMAMKEMLGEKFDGKQIGGIDPVQDPKAFQVAQNYIEEQLRNVEPIDRMIGLAKSIATFKFLGFNLRSLAVNTTAIITTAPAAIHQYALGGKGSMMGIIKELAVSGKDYAALMAGKKLADADEQAFLDEVQKKGWDDAQYTREALGEISKTHSRIWSSMMDGSMYLFGKSEKWNRGTTMLAAYRLARKQGMGHGEAAEVAKEASDKAHGVYGKSTMPMWAQGTNPAAKLGQLFYVYQKFGHNYLQMLYDMGAKKKNIKGMMFAFLSPLVLAGGAALPFKDALFSFAGFILKALFGEDRDPEKWVWDEIRKHLGLEAEKIGRHGLTGALGVDISGSLSAGVGIPKNFIDLTGAIGGVATEIKEAGESLRNKQYGKAAEHLLPTGFANPLRAIRESSQGVTTRNNRPVWDEKGRPYKPEGGATLARTFGFRSTDQAVLSERTWEGHRQQADFADKRNAIYERYRAWTLGKRDREEYKEIVKEVQDYNRKIREHRIPGVSPITSQSLQNQARRMAAPSKNERALLRNP